MPRNSAGVYSLLASDVNPPISGTTIDPVAFAAQNTDLGSEITNSLDRLGRGPMQAPLAMGGFRITGVAAPVAPTDTARILDISNYLPAGVIMPWGGGLIAPSGWLLCDGSAYVISTYPNLSAALGTTWNTTAPSGSFNVPDFRGAFLRGLDSGKGLDPSRVLATFQADMFASHTHVQNSHTHVLTDPGHNHSVTVYGGSSTPGGAFPCPGGSGSGVTGTNTTGITIAAATAVNQTTGSAETAPKNWAVPFIIRT